jgi:hypothetical protein
MLLQALYMHYKRPHIIHETQLFVKPKTKKSVFLKRIFNIRFRLFPFGEFRNDEEGKNFKVCRILYFLYATR